MILVTDLLVQLKGCARIFHRAINYCNAAHKAERLANWTLRSRFPWRMLNHCSIWLSYEQCAGGKWQTKRACAYQMRQAN